MLINFCQNKIEEKQIEIINNQILENKNEVVVLAFEEHIEKINIDKDKIINLKIVSEHMWYLKGEIQE